MKIAVSSQDNDADDKFARRYRMCRLLPLYCEYNAGVILTASPSPALAHTGYLYWSKPVLSLLLVRHRDRCCEPQLVANYVRIEYIYRYDAVCQGPFIATSGRKRTVCRLRNASRLKSVVRRQRIDVKTLVYPYYRKRHSLFIRVVSIRHGAT